MTQTPYREPTATVVIPTRDRPHQLSRCLESLRRIDGPELEIVVVDSAPRRTHADDIAERWGARYELEPLPGASRARNRGARVCRSDVILFVDDDALPEP